MADLPERGGATAARGVPGAAAPAVLGGPFCPRGLFAGGAEGLVGRATVCGGEEKKDPAGGAPRAAPDAAVCDRVTLAACSASISSAARTSACSNIFMLSLL